MKVVKLAEDTYGYICPGCGNRVGIKIPPWGFNGDMEKPTFNGSVKQEGTEVKSGKTDYLCHALVKDGKTEFLNDCTHELRGKTIDMPDITKNDYFGLDK